ncbi:MAG TPA: CocE/NonD family hydrolase [Candidatus Thermoplasmatota archaeon]|nr:CocE/NonD family hydrolase [Candidatus Thermoplasmatota archaeon]
MRALLVAAVLLASGCVAPALTKNAATELQLPDVPKGATVEPIEGGLRLVFDAIAFPFEQNVTIPAGTTLVRAKGLVGPDDTLSVSMRNADTGRRRCNFAPVDAWDAPVAGEGQCTGVALVDALPATWTVRGASPAGKGRVEVELLTTPLDGPLAQLDTSQLSMRTYELEETTIEKLPSFDGTKLHVEVTLPTGPGPWPTVISSSPYNHADRLASGQPAMWAYFTNDWAQRGYAVINADVRGYGFSEGCVEVWSENEQKDQAFLVDWVAQQPWSDGNVGFYGQSYVATTPVEAAVQAPDALKAIIAVAPVADSYNDWHFGGVPNGEDAESSLEYQLIGMGEGISTDPTDYMPSDPQYLLDRADNGVCDPTLTAEANDPRALYDAFYVERNFSARAGDVKAAVLYTQGFEDSNVKSALIPDWFTNLQSPKLGLFGHWIHQHPTRADNEALFLLWFDQYVKGKPVGFEKLDPVRVTTNDGRERTAKEWPPADGQAFTLALDPAGGTLASAPAEGSATIFMDPGRNTLPVSLSDLPLPTLLAMKGEPLTAPVHFAGQGKVDIDATLEHAQNAYVAAYLYQTVGDETSLVTWGMFNLAHRNGHDTYAPVQPMERVHVGIPLLPTEWVFPAGATLSLEIRGAGVMDWALVKPVEPGELTVYAENSALVLPTVADDATWALPAAAQR